MTTPETPPPGWYDDPDHSGSLRYWDGATWTNHREPKPTPPMPKSWVWILVALICVAFMLVVVGQVVSHRMTDVFSTMNNSISN